MPTPDEELSRLFKEGRAADRDAAPSFEKTIAASERQKRSGFPVVAVALAAAVALTAFWLWPGGEQPAIPQENAKIAQTNPLPDLPDQEEEKSIDRELEALAAWEPSGASPTDFLLEEQGMLGDVMAPSELDELVLESEDLLMEL